MGMVRLKSSVWMSPSQYAEHSGLNEWTVRKLCRMGVIPSCNTGGRYFIPFKKADMAMETELYRPKGKPFKKKRHIDYGEVINKQIEEAGGFEAAIDKILADEKAAWKARKEQNGQI